MSSGMSDLKHGDSSRGRHLCLTPSSAVSQFRGCSLPRLHLKTDCVTVARRRLSQSQDSFKWGRQMQPSFPEFEGSIACILRSPAYPKMHCGPVLLLCVFLADCNASF